MYLGRLQLPDFLMCEWQVFLSILGCFIFKWKEVKGGEVCGRLEECVGVVALEGA